MASSALGRGSSSASPITPKISAQPSAIQVPVMSIGIGSRRWRR